jgi:hypothetical protein
MRRLALTLVPLVAAAAALLARGVAGPVPPVVHGRVIGPGGPVPGTRVRAKATDQVTTTDTAGRFHLLRAGARHVTAAADGFLIAGVQPLAAPLTLRLTPAPTRDNPGYNWVDPTPDPSSARNCGNCHAEIYREWVASGHSHSASGGRFRELYDGTDAGVGAWGLLRQHPEAAGVCTACHAPAAREDDSAYYDLRALRGTARSGVHCDYCHKVAGASEGSVGLAHGRFGLRLLRPAGDAGLFFGPLDDVDRSEDIYSAFYHDSRYCASCHEGTVTGVHAYSTYSEWLDSAARRQGKQCQDCHMAATGRMTNVAPGHGGHERDPRTLANHRFFAGDQAAMLQECVRVQAAFTCGGDAVRVRLVVSADGVGHRVPTGLPDRHLILVAEGQDARRRALQPCRGPRLPTAAGERLRGRPGRLYAKLLRDFNGHSPAPFWAAEPDFDDNRLTPGRPDLIELEFPPGLAVVRVRVLYRPFWDEIARTRQWPDADVVVFREAFAVGP